MGGQAPPFFYNKNITMAINVNTVYQTVLLILNKEQRGYITPTEFNSLATQVQLEIFEQYFEDLNQQWRVPRNDSEFADRVQNIENKIALFKTYGDATYYDEDPSGSLANPYFYLPEDLHRLGAVIYKGEQELQATNRSEYLHLNMSQLTRPSTNYPLYIFEGTATPLDPVTSTVLCTNCDKLYIYPDEIKSKITVSYIRKPKDVVWAYSLGSLNQYLYTTNIGAGVIPSTGSVIFEIDSTEQTEVILRILMYSGVVIRDPQIIQAAAAQVQAEEQNDKS